MILKTRLFSAIFLITWINGSSGGSYSQVYVDGGSNGYGYAAYGAPSPAVYGSQIAKYSAPPVGSLPPYAAAAPYVTPCVSPCIPSQAVVSVPNAGIVSYAAPSAPIIVANDAPSNYQYSYLVYDDGTGDQKAARELSNEGVVQGQYSVLQPDGYVREVQYTADDAKGFNAVVSYLPQGGVKTVLVKDTNPCPDTKSEPLKVREELKNEDTPASGDAATGKEPAETDAVPKNKEELTSIASETEQMLQPEGSQGEKLPVEAESAVVTEEKPAETDKSKEVAVDAVVQDVMAPLPPPSVPAIITNTLPFGYVSYDELLKCIQKMRNANLQTNSPLTYILLPYKSKPC